MPVEEVLSLIREKKKKRELTFEPECVKCHSTSVKILVTPSKEVRVCKNCNHREINVFDSQA